MQTLTINRILWLITIVLVVIAASLVAINLVQGDFLRTTAFTLEDETPIDPTVLRESEEEINVDATRSPSISAEDCAALKANYPPELGTPPSDICE